MMGNQERSAAPTVADSKAAFPPELAGADDGLDEALDQALRILGHSPSTNQKCASSADASGVATNAADRRAKLRVLYSNDAFRAELGRSSREEMQALADSSLFRVLCSCLREGDPLEFAHVGECVCHCIRTVPELVVDAWAFGAVRPIVACLLKKRKLNDKRALLRDSGLQHSLCFVMCMGMPLKAPGCSEAAKNVSRKCIGWFIRQGVFVKVGEVSVALSQSGPECKQEKFLAFVFYAVASLLVAAQYTLSSRGEGAGLEQQKGLVGAVLHFIQLDCKRQPSDPDYGLNTSGGGFGPVISVCHSIVDVCISLLLRVWLLTTKPPELDVSKRRKREIAEHPSIINVLNVLRHLVDSRASANSKDTQDCFVDVVRLLTCAHPRPLSPSTIETAVRLMGDPSARESWDFWALAMARGFHSGAVTPEFLLAHFFPGFLRAFAAEVERQRPARVYTPELQFLIGALIFLSDAFWFAHPPDKPAKEKESDNENAIAIPAKLLPGLVDLMIETRAAAAVATLTGSAMYFSASQACGNLASVAACSSLEQVRRLAEQIIPASFDVMLAGSQDDELMRRFRIGLPGYVTARLVPELPEFTITPLPAGAPERDVVRYNWERTRWRSVGM